MSVLARSGRISEPETGQTLGALNALDDHRGKGVAASLLTAVLVAVVLVNIPGTVLRPQVDASWGAVLTYAHQHGLGFGKEIVFPYGPLGFLFTFDFADYLTGFRLVFNFTLAYVVSAGACLLAWRMSPMWRAIFLIFLVTSPANIVRVPDLTFPIGLLCWGLLCVTTPSGRLGTVYTLILAVLVAILGLVKFPYFVEGSITLTAVALDRFLRGEVKVAGLVFGLMAVSFVAVWIALGQNITGIAGYLVNSLAITSGYDLTMGTAAAREIRMGGVATALFTVVAICAKTGLAPKRGVPFADRGRVLIAVWLVLLTFCSWKHGYVRADGHVAIFLGFAAVLSLALEAIDSPSRRARLLVHSSAIVVCLLCWVNLEWMFPGVTDRRFDRTFQRFAASLRTLIRPSAYIQDMRQALNIQRERNQLPNLRQHVGNAAVDVFGKNQVYAVFNELAYRPRPVFQSYCAYTPSLGRLNDDFFRGEAAPDFVFFDLSPIDERLPAVEDSRALATILTRYDLVDGEGIFLLLKRARSSGPTRSLVREGTAAPGQKILLPDWGTNQLWMEIILKSSWLGRLQEFFYQPPRLKLSFNWASGFRNDEEFRTPAPMLAAGFIVSPLLRNNFDVVDLYAGNSNAYPASVSVQISDRDRKMFRNRFQYRLYRFQSPLAAAKNPALIRLKWPGFKSMPAEVFSPQLPVRLTTVDAKPAISVQPSGYLKFTVLPGETTISGSYGFEETAYQAGNTDGAEFLVEAESEDAARRVLHSQFLDPKASPKDRGLHKFEVNLPPGTRTVLLRTLPGPNNDTGWDLTCWAGIGLLENRNQSQRDRHEPTADTRLDNR